MNKKRKVLTLAALAVFGAIIGLHYMPIYQHSYSDWHLINPTEAALHWPHYLPSDYEKVVVPGGFRLPPLIDDVRMPLFVLAVFYTGLFFVLGPDKSKNHP